MTLSKQTIRSLNPIFWKRIDSKKNLLFLCKFSNHFWLMFWWTEGSRAEECPVEAASWVYCCSDHSTVTWPSKGLHLYQLVLHNNSNIKGHRKHWSEYDVEAVVGSLSRMKKGPWFNPWHRREEEREGTKACSSQHTISVLKQCLWVVKCNLISSSILYIYMHNWTTHMQPQDKVSLYKQPLPPQERIN